MAIVACVLVVILLIAGYSKVFLANVPVLTRIVAGCVLAVGLGKMGLDKVARAQWFDMVTPFVFGLPTFDPVMVLTMTMTLVMIVVMIESTGMFLALSDMTDRPITQTELAAGLRTDGLGTLIGGIFNTFPHTSFSQNVGRVGVTGEKSRYVCVAAGLIMIRARRCRPGDVRHGRGHRHPHSRQRRLQDQPAQPVHRCHRHWRGMIPLVAPRWSQQMPHALHPLLESGILLTAVAAVALNQYFNGGKGGEAEAVAAAKMAEAH